MKAVYVRYYVASILTFLQVKRRLWLCGRRTLGLGTIKNLRIKAR